MYGLRGFILMKSRVSWFIASVVAFSMLGTLPGFAQDPGSSSGGWRRFEPSTAQPDRQALPPEATSQTPPSAAGSRALRSNPAYHSGGNVDHRSRERAVVERPQSARRRIQRNSGAAVVVNGLVVAHAGQTVVGTVSEAKKAGRASGLSRLGLELIEIGTGGRQPGSGPNENDGAARRHFLWA